MEGTVRSVISDTTRTVYGNFYSRHHGQYAALRQTTVTDFTTLGYPPCQFRLRSTEGSCSGTGRIGALPISSSMFCASLRYRESR